MPREYRHIQQYKKELFEMQPQVLTLQRIANKFEFSREQIKNILSLKEERNTNWQQVCFLTEKADRQKNML